MLPPAPERLPGARCVAASMPVAVTRDGVAIVAATATAAGGGLADACGRRTAASGLPFHRESLACLDRPRTHRRPLGTARDGFPLYGTSGARRLDRCHGHTHRTGGGRTYHYHWTRGAPFTVGCFRGRPARWSWGLSPGIVPPPLALPAPAPAPAPADSPPPPPAAEPVPVQDDRPAGGWPQVAADPALRPAFDPAIRDYVTRCDPATPIDVSVAAPAGTRVSVDGRAAREGSFTEAVTLGASEATSIAVTSRASTGTFHVRCVPPEVPDWTVEASAPTESAFFITTPLAFPSGSPPVVIADGHGTPVWWKADANAIDAKLLPGGQLSWTAWSRRSYATDGTYRDFGLDGTAGGTWTTGGGIGADHHDMQALPGGDRLLLAYREREHVDLRPYVNDSDATVLDGEVQRVASDGTVRWTWSTRDHVDLAETGRWWGGPPVVSNAAGEQVYDIVHINSVEPDGDGFIVSLRHTDAVYRVDEASGAVEWKLGGTATPERLAVKGDAHPVVATFGGQHDARRLADGSVTVADNRSGYPSDRPRAVRFTIDEAARVATFAEQVTDVDPPPLSCCGGARRLAGGWAISWGGSETWGEYALDGTPRLRVTFPPGLFSYRVDPVLPGRLDITTLRAGMDAMHPRTG
jgi:hypothetical protein